MSNQGWLDANQTLLVAEFSRINALISGGSSAAADRAIAEARAAMPSPGAIDLLVGAFGLSDFERDTVLLCAAAEMDGVDVNVQTRREAVAARAHPTFSLALTGLPNPHWSAILPVSPLRRCRLLEVSASDEVLSGRLRLDERVMHFLAGLNYLDVRLQPLLSAKQRISPLSERHAHAVDLAVAELQAQTHAPVVQLHGRDALSQSAAAATIAHRLGFALYVIHSRDLPRRPDDVQSFAQLWTREALLLNAALLIEVGEQDIDTLGRITRDLGGLVMVATARVTPMERPDLRFLIDEPQQQEQIQLWRTVLGEHANGLNGALDGIAKRFRVGAEVMREAAENIQATPLGAERNAESVILRTCREAIHRRLEGLAERVEPVATWRDLVLPDAQLSTLREIAIHVRRKSQVYEEWGFGGGGRGLGISALFSGESGTGKTMAAEVLADDLQIDLFRIDLASMVSKYIGETEKNLRRVFDAAEDGAAILLFDEADALFGKRSEVNDSHDRFANIEISYLLQRMEAYRGLAILTTNLKSALDSAFYRRLRFVVQFPFPDLSLRERIWQNVFPPQTPTQGLDHRRLGQLNVSGGNIRNIAMNAAFLAAETRSPIGMSHVLKAATRDAAKRERPYSDAEVRGWV